MSDRQVRIVGVLAILAIVAGLTYLVVPQVTAGPLSHYTLVRSLADGTARIDKTRFETGTSTTIDLSYYKGHYYSNKGPGLAFATLPEYLVLDRLGYRGTGDHGLMLWALGLSTVVLPALLLLFLVRAVAERIAPGFGTAAAVTLGLGTLLTPYTAMFYPHVLSAFLVFSAFALLFFEREGRSRIVLVGIAGLLAGYAVVTEYSNVVAAPLLGIYALLASDRLRRGLAFVGGFAVGVLPLVLYNWWAFGSITHLSYHGQVESWGKSGHDVIFEHGAEALSLPSFHVFVWLFLSKWGLATTAAVVIPALAGTWLVFRSGRRAEAFVIGGTALAYAVFNSAYYYPSGSVAPGHRFLIGLLPFAAVALAPVYRAFPGPAFALALGSIAVTVAMTVTRPLAAYDGQLLERLTSPGLKEYTPVLPDFFVVSGWYRMLPFFAAVLFAVGAAGLATRMPRITRGGYVGAAVAACAWILHATQGQKLVDTDVVARPWGAIALALLVPATVFVVARVSTGKLSWSAVRPARRLRSRPQAGV